MTKINRQDKSVTLHTGEELAYDKLLLMTGARVRKLLIPGAELDGICYVRTIADVEDMKAVHGPWKQHGGDWWRVYRHGGRRGRT